MKKYLALFAALGLMLGAGCSNTTPTSAPVSSQPTQPKAEINTPAVTQPSQNPVSEQPSTQTPPPVASSTSTTNPSVTPSKATSTPAASTATGARPVVSPKTYTMTDVEASVSAGKCWTVINGKVYDVGEWEKKHPGGEPAIKKLCGIDGSSLFNGKHGGQPQPEQALAGFQIGTVKK